MLDFNDINGWITNNVIPAANFKDIPSSAVDSLLALYDKQTPEFNESAKRILANHNGRDVIDVIATLKKKGFNPNVKNRTDNGAGCVILSSNPRANEYKIVAALVLPLWYCMLVTLDLDGKKNVLGGGIIFKSYYETPKTKPFILTAQGAGETFDKIFEFKNKVDSMSKIEEDSKPMPAKVKFVMGKGLVKDED